MKFVSVRDFRIKPGAVWSNLEKKEEVVVITSNGKPIALMTGVNDINLDETIRALRRAKAELSVSRIRQTADRKRLSRPSPKEIEDEIAAVRKKRK